MLDKETRAAALTLHAKGQSARKIAQAMDISRNTLKKVLKEGVAELLGPRRAGPLDEHLDEIRFLHSSCRGNLVRVHEELIKKLKAQGKPADFSYPSLTRFCRIYGIGVEEKTPAARIVTEKGEEMQCDTSLYNIVIGGKKVKRHCAGIVLGYSRMLYVAFFPKFDRFHLKIFLTDAFQYFGGCCRVNVIDNTSIAIACGSGSMAQMAPEIEAFEKRFGFRFMAHEIGHCDRKGKIERIFFYVETNFLAGRTFKDDDDLNRQSIEWLENTVNCRQLRELRAKPIELFAAEKPHLVALPIYVPEVYRLWQKPVDDYGYIRLHELKYQAPDAYLGKSVQVRETKNKVILLDGTKELACYDKKIEGTLRPNAHRRPCRPRKRGQSQLLEEARLKSLGQGVEKYLEALKADKGPRYIWAVRKLYKLFCQYNGEDLQAALAKALEHRLWDPSRIETIILQKVAQRDYLLPLAGESKDYESQADYQKGAVTPEPDLNRYLPKDEENKPDDRGNPETS